uniref:Pepsin inhibitor-3-like repeated domain-containing protein n=1 Tax=Acrobeloides nanus TaxID=290746 RepID=A0A914E7I0_9BILA
MPIRPTMPGFCSKGDTTLYIFAGCIVQNYKVYVGGKHARDLNQKEKRQLDIFIKQMNGSGDTTTQAPKTTVKIEATSPSSTTTLTPAMDDGKAKQITLDFCTEF